MSSAPPPRQDQPPDGFEAWEETTARAEVSAFLSAQGWLRGFTREDLYWDCLAHWWESRQRYDEKRGASRRTFMKHVLRNYLADLRRRENAEKRRADHQALSLDAPVSGEGDDVGSLAELLADERAGGRPAEAAERAELTEEINRVRSELMPRQRELLDGIRAGYSKSELSRLLATPRSTLSDEWTRIRDVFRAQGLDKFLE